MHLQIFNRLLQETVEHLFNINKQADQTLSQSVQDPKKNKNNSDDNKSNQKNSNTPDILAKQFLEQKAD